MRHPPPDRSAADDGFDAFYRSYAPRLAGQLLALTGDAATAEDITQEAFMRASSRWARISGYDSPQAWVRRVAVNLARSEMRRTVRHIRALQRHGAPADVPEIGVDDLATLQALRELPHGYREVVVLHHLVGLRVEEIAAMLAMPAGTVRSRLARGRERLAGLLTDPQDAVTLPGAGTDGGTA
jgi:RNA polymerase sigma-70 factor (ECF subfamily)